MGYIGGRRVDATRTDEGMTAHALQGEGVKPIGSVRAAACFLAPAALMALSLYALEPALVSAGMSPWYAGAICLYSPLGLLGVAAVLLARREEGTGRVAFRLGLLPLRGADWAWAAGLAVAMILPFPLVNLVVAPVLEANPWSLPVRMPELLRTGAVDWMASSGAPIAGNWLLALAATAGFAANVLGEELAWRGWLLPRQMAASGRRAWLSHGLLWALFHAPKWWAIPAILPGALAMAFVATRRRNTSIAIAAHAAANGIGLASLLLAVTGS